MSDLIARLPSVPESCPLDAVILERWKSASPTGSSAPVEERLRLSEVRRVYYDRNATCSTIWRRLMIAAFRSPSSLATDRQGRNLRAACVRRRRMVDQVSGRNQNIGTYLLQYPDHILDVLVNIIAAANATSSHVEIKYVLACHRHVL